MNVNPEKSPEMENRTLGDAEWSSTYTSIESRHNEAYKIIDEAICLEEQEKPLEVN